MKFTLTILLLFLVFAGRVFSQGMQSAHYNIMQDSFVVGNSNSASGSSYRVLDSFGDFRSGEIVSANYKIIGGSSRDPGRGKVQLQMVSPPDIALAPLSISKASAVGSAEWLIRTNNVEGYQISVRADNTPALRDSSTGNGFADYTEAVSGVPESWSVANTHEFGFSAFGTDVLPEYGASNTCESGTDIPATSLNWRGFVGTSTIAIVNRASAALGWVPTAVCFATEQNGVFTPSGEYQAVITVTVIAN